jgi:hypothetical protein
MALKARTKPPRKDFLRYPWIQLFINGGEFGENYASLSKQFVARPNRRFEFHKRSQQFIRTHDEALTVAMCVCNPDCSPKQISLE